MPVQNLTELVRKLENKETITVDDILWLWNDCKETPNKYLRDKILGIITKKEMAHDYIAFYMGEKRDFLIDEENVDDIVEWCKKNKEHNLARGVASNSCLPDLLGPKKAGKLFAHAIRTCSRGKKEEISNFPHIVKDKFEEEFQELKEEAALQAIIDAMSKDKNFRHTLFGDLDLQNEDQMRRLIEAGEKADARNKTARIIGDFFAHKHEVQSLPDVISKRLDGFAARSPQHRLSLGWKKIGRAIYAPAKSISVKEKRVDSLERFVNPEVAEYESFTDQSRNIYLKEAMNPTHSETEAAYYLGKNPKIVRRDNWKVLVAFRDKHPETKFAIGLNENEVLKQYETGQVDATTKVLPRPTELVIEPEARKVLPRPTEPVKEPEARKVLPRPTELVIEPDDEPPPDLDNVTDFTLRKSAKEGDVLDRIYFEARQGEKTVLSMSMSELVEKNPILALLVPFLVSMEN
jgi:hypothetical protein